MSNKSDWGCEYCGSIVPGDLYRCENCGHPKTHESARLGKVQEFLYELKDKALNLTSTALLDEVTIVDASTWNGDIAYSILATKAQGIILRAGLGLNRDARFNVNRAGAIEHRFPYGLYWAPIIAPGYSPAAQAEVFKNIYREMPSQIPLAVDLEKTYFTTVKETTAFCQAFCQEVRSKTGVSRGLLYTRKSWWDWWISPDAVSWSSWWECWPAHWTTALTPLLPRGWSTWRLHQYSADNNGLASLYGFTGGDPDIDLNRFHGTTAEYIAWLGGVPIPPLPDEQPINPLMYVMTTANLNMRALPDATSADIGTVGYGSDVPVTEINGDWYKVEGWINKNYTVPK